MLNKQPPSRRTVLLAGIAGGVGVGGGIGAAAVRRAAYARPASVGAAAAQAQAAANAAGGFPSDVLLLVAGPDRGDTAAWAQLLAPALERALPPGTQVGQEAVGGADGVTGANQFETRATPDGSTALLLPGAAGLAWLIGDPRARYDASAWMPALATVSAGALASRVPLQRLRGRPVRLAASNPGGPELPALLALELLGATAAPIFGLTDEAGAVDAVLSGAADAAYLRGRRVRENVQVLADAGAPPILTMGAGEDPQGGRDPLLPGVPCVAELLSWEASSGGGAAQQMPLVAAWRAAAAASQTEAMLVLPQLTPASAVAVWRRGCAHAAAAQDVQDAATSLGLRTVPPPAAAGATAVVGQSALLALRGWLAERWRWRPA